MVTIVHRARGAHPKFFVAQYYKADLFFCMSKSGDLLVVPKPYRQVLLDEVHFSLLSGHFSAEKVCFLLSGRVWWPNIFLSCEKAVSYYAIFYKNKPST